MFGIGESFGLHGSRACELETGKDPPETWTVGKSRKKDEGTVDL